MSERHACITYVMDDVRSCTVRGEHQPWCDGYARVWDPELKRLAIDDTRECPGCLPRPAEFGYLCYSHLVRFDAALEQAPTLVAFMLEDGTNGIRDTNGGGSGGYESQWTITESRLLASWVVAAFANTTRVLDGDTDGLDLTYLDHRDGLRPGARTADLSYVVGHLQAERDALITTPLGAEAAVRLTDTVHRAYIRFPLEETARRIAGVRCPQCRQARLTRKPPLMFRDDVVITCENCGHTEPQAWLEQYAGMMGLS